jgi:lipid-binding SYLF domain-containing protein
MATTAVTMLAVIASPASFAHDKAQLDARADKAVKHFYTLSPMNKELAGKAAGVLIFPKVTKAGAGVAGEHGDGVLRINGKTVDYYSVSSASVGLTLGVGQHTEMIMFMTQDALDNFKKSDGWSVGADTAVAVVSKGAGGAYDTATLNKPILGFVLSQKGLIGDLSFEGSKISKDKD